MTDIRRSRGPKHGPGTTLRPQRVREFLHLKALEIRRTQPGLSEVEVHRQAQHELGAAIAGGGQELLRKVEQLAPVCTAPDRRSVHRMVEVAAITRLPGMRWLAEQLERYASSGPHTDYSCAIAVLLAMASGVSRPRIRAARQLLDGNALAGFALRHPLAKPESSVYDNIQTIYERTHPELACIVNVDLIRRLAQSLPDRPGRLPTRVGEVGVVDGTDIPGNFQQRKPVDQIMRALLIGPHAPRAAYVRYVAEDGQPFKRWSGYKLVLISDLASTLPLVWGLFAANVDERRAAGSLIETLFELWPDCPMSYLVGDADYDHAEQFHIDLESRWSIHPVFAAHGSA
ncbi:MAG TPA: transposase [Solirubrobacteraceae bacterium]|nr:transposase [Solirubrobacteraceae bacterium]